MSISTTRKFIVRGKSVDFKNREGSSPSIPRPLQLPNFLSYALFSLMVQNSLSFSLIRFYPGLYFSFFTSLVIYMIDIQMNIFEQNKKKEFPFEVGMIKNQNNYSEGNLRSRLFFLKYKTFQATDQTLEYFFVFFLIDIDPVI